MVRVFREVWRVLRKDGCLWLNLGDSYSGDSKGVTPLTEDYTPVTDREVDRVWLAAIMDGEGSISGTYHVRKDDGSTRTDVRMHVTNSDRRLLDECERIFPLGKTEFSEHRTGHLGKRDVWRWIPSGDSRSELLREIYPYLISKKDQARLAWNLLEMSKEASHLGKVPQRRLMKERREWIVQALSRLNHGQKVDIPEWAEEPPPLLYQAPGIPRGNLIGCPWRVALALQADGWVLRSDIPWCKRSPLPESQTSRPAKALEYVFMFTQGSKYYYDHHAIRRVASSKYTSANAFRVTDRDKAAKDSGSKAATAMVSPNRRSHDVRAESRNFWQSDLWFESVDQPHGLCGVVGANGDGTDLVGIVADPEPFGAAHYAVFPSGLIEPFIKVSASEYGCCSRCRTPYVRLVKKVKVFRSRPNEYVKRTPETSKDGQGNVVPNTLAGIEVKTIGWKPGCSCEDPDAEDPGDPYPVVPCTVLDPFVGSGTTVAVAVSLGRAGVGIDLSREYLSNHAVKKVEGALLSRGLMNLSPAAMQAARASKNALADVEGCSDREL
jgi:hypothetical protein